MACTNNITFTSCPVAEPSIGGCCPPLAPTPVPQQTGVSAFPTSGFVTDTGYNCALCSQGDGNFTEITCLPNDGMSGWVGAATPPGFEPSNRGSYLNGTFSSDTSGPDSTVLDDPPPYGVVGLNDPCLIAAPYGDWEGLGAVIKSVIEVATGVPWFLVTISIQICTQLAPGQTEICTGSFDATLTFISCSQGIGPALLPVPVPPGGSCTSHQSYPPTPPACAIGYATFFGYGPDRSNAFCNPEDVLNWADFFETITSLYSYFEAAGTLTVVNNCPQ